MKKNLKKHHGKKLLLLTILLWSNMVGYGQYYKKWVVYNHQLNTAAAPPTTGSLPTAGSGVSNAVYNATPTLLFYVSNNHIYKSDGTSISDIGCTVWQEIPICKVPDSTDYYYVIHACPAAMSYIGVEFTMIKVTGTTPSVVSGKENVTFTGAHTYYESAYFAIKVDNETLPKYLYICDLGGNIDQYSITPTTISYLRNITTLPNGGPDCEMEISWDGSKLAIPSYLSNIYIVDLDCGTGQYDNNTTTYSNLPGNGGGACGVEFNDAGDHLFFTTQGGIYDLTVSSGNISTVTSTSNTYAESFLERGYNNNGKILVANPTSTGYLGSFGQSTYSFNSTAVACSLTTSPAGNKYTLPDQNDFLYGIAGADGTYGTMCNPLVIGRPAPSDCVSCTYSWSPGTGLSATNVAQPTATPSSTTTYTLTRTCSGVTTIDKVTVTIMSCARPTPPSEEEAAQTGKDVKIIPNPSSGIFEIQMSNSDEFISYVSIYDLDGKMVKFINNPFGNLPSLSVDATDLSKGVYFTEVNSNGTKYLKKMIIE
jgi:hypothetical protein